MGLTRELWTDTQLSWKAKGILLYFLAHPNEAITQADLVQAGVDGRDAVASGLRELTEAGYLRLEQTRDRGRIVGQRYVVADDVAVL